MELSDRPTAFSDLVGTRVRDQSGRSLGRVLEVRGQRRGDGTIVLAELLVGRRALWLRLRGPEAGPDVRGIPWQAVIEMTSERIVIRR